MKTLRLALILVLFLGIYVLATAAVPVEENQSALIFQFGRVIRIVDQPGLHWKLPDPIQTRFLISRKIKVYDPEAREYLTEDKKNIVIDYFFTYQIADPLQFHRVLKDDRIADVTLDDLVNSALGSSLGRYELTSLINTRPEMTRMTGLLDEVVIKTAAMVSETGVKVNSIKIKRLTFPRENEQAIYARMFSERQKIATQYRSEGMEQARKIKAEADLEMEKVLARAKKEAACLRGEADAEALNLFAGAWRKNPEMYAYIRKLEIYREVITDKDVLVMSNNLVGGELDMPDVIGKPYRSVRE